MKNNQGGRPTLAELEIERVVIRIALTLYEGEDDDLIEWFDSLDHGKRAHSVKIALRQGGMSANNNEAEFDEFISDDLLDDLLGTL